MKSPKFLVSFLLALLFPLSVIAQFKYWNVLDTATIPKRLSGTGIYTTGSLGQVKKTLISEANHYAVNSPVWTDGSINTRWFILPPGKAVTFDALNDYWQYPDSTVFIKQLEIDSIPGNASSRKRIETQILLNIKSVIDSSKLPYQYVDKWYPVSYRWLPDQLDAELIPSSKRTGVNDSIRIYPDGLANPFKIKKWHFYGQVQCRQCHQVNGESDSTHGRSLLGFFTAQLNRPHPDSLSVNQLDYFFSKGLLKMPGTAKKPTDWNVLPRWAAISDNSASIDVRARSYIATTCSGCHGRRGMGLGAPGGATINFDFHTMAPQIEVRHYRGGFYFGLEALPPLFYNTTTDSIANPMRVQNLPILPALLVPGYPEKSLLFFRQTVRNSQPGDYSFDSRQMPYLGNYEVNVAAMDLLRRWILEMTPILPPSSIRSIRPSIAFTAPVIIGNELRFADELPGEKNIIVRLTNLKGSSQILPRIQPGSYRLPTHISPGLYFIGANDLVFAKFLF